MKEAFPYRRRKDWGPRWIRFISESQQMGKALTLDWTHMNCLKWACMGIEELTGQNPYEEFNPEDSSIRAVAKTILSRGYENLDQIIESYFEEVPIGLAQQGDLVLVNSMWGDDEETAAFSSVMPHGVALVDPPFFWCVMPGGLGKGELYKNGFRAFAVGRDIN